jgi:hypothetical protein
MLNLVKSRIRNVMHVHRQRTLPKSFVVDRFVLFCFRFVPGSKALLVLPCTFEPHSKQRKFRFVVSSMFQRYNNIKYLFLVNADFTLKA